MVVAKARIFLYCGFVVVHVLRCGVPFSDWNVEGL